jgi:hypothetical protein
MLKASELRIGNLVLCNTSIGFVDTIVPISNLSSDEIVCYYKPTKQFIFCKDALFEPIPLTEEWLLKFGFELDIEDDGYFKGKYKVSVSDEGCIFFIYDNYYPIEICEFKYIHQLQNLYFALTNTELTIK